MVPAIEKHYIPVSKERFDAVYVIALNSKLSADQKRDELRAAFAKHRVPINACADHIGGGKWSFVDAANYFHCEPLMELIVEQAARGVPFGLDMLAECVWSERCVKTLLDRGCVINDIKSYGDIDNYVDVPVLKRCAEDGSIGAIGLLAAHGMDMNRKISSYGTPTPALVHAAQYGKTTIVEGFLRAGADPMYAAASGETFLHASVRLISAIATEMYDNPENVTKLRRVLSVANELGIDVNLSDGEGRTPLHLAARLGYKNKVAALLEHGANPDLRDKANKTALMLARSSKRQDAASVLTSWRAHQAVMKTIQAAAGRSLSAPV